jgi:uncharacterized protein YjbI with pentapeptide repeats
MNKRNIKKCFYNFVKWIVWDFSCFRFIWSKILLPTSESEGGRRPSTFLFWVVGTYIAFFGVASQRYENRIDIIENRTNTIFTQLASPAFKSALSRISNVQKMFCPHKPYLLYPASVFRSLFGNLQENSETVLLLRETIENWKESLDGVDLTRADIEEAQLDNANLNGALLIASNLRGANLENADLRNANIVGADLDGAYLMNANLTGINGNLYSPETDEKGGSFFTKEEKIINKLGINDYSVVGQLSKARSLYGAKLDPKINDLLMKLNPRLFQSPLPSAPRDFHIIE